jgi:hypothetical protein
MGQVNKKFPNDTFQFSCCRSSDFGFAIPQETLVSRNELGFREFWTESALQLPIKRANRQKFMKKIRKSFKTEREKSKS